MALADGRGCETQAGQLSSAFESAPPVLGKANNCNNSHAISELQEAPETEEEQQDPVEDNRVDSLIARLNELPDPTGPAEYTKYTPPWYPSQQRYPEPDHRYIPKYCPNGSSATSPPLERHTSKAATSGQAQPRLDEKGMTPESCMILRSWCWKNPEDAYPNEQEMGKLMLLSGMTHDRVADWFNNERRRRGLYDRSVEEEAGLREGNVEERPGGGERAGAGESTLDWNGNEKVGSAEEAGLDKLAQNPVQVKVAGKGDDDWEILSLSDEEEHEASGKEVVAEQQGVEELRKA